MVDFIIIGPLSRDRIIKGDKVYDAVGGPVYYQAAVFSAFGVDNTVVTTLARDDEELLEGFTELSRIIPVYKERTMEFENIYPDDNPNHRIQKSKVPINPIITSDFDDIDFKSIKALLLSPLSPYDIPLETLEFLENQGKPIYLGAQGYLRYIDGFNISLKPWINFKNFLKQVDFLFLDELEARILLGDTDGNCGEIARTLTLFGPEEVIITRGDRGALIYSKRVGIYDIPAVYTEKIVDPTGLGDTFMAAYALKKQETSDPLECGRFATKISSLKMERKGAFRF
jgi:sugar/nucleoside kinase (ribokinase family)